MQLSETFRSFLTLAAIIGSTITIGIWIGQVKSSIEALTSQLEKQNGRITRIEDKILDCADIRLD